MPTQRTVDIRYALERVACPEPGSAAPRGTPGCRRLDGGEQNRRKKTTHKKLDCRTKEKLTSAVSALTQVAVRGSMT